MQYIYNLYGEIILKILLCLFLTGLIGYNREKKGMTVGIRTHVLVGISAVLLQISAIQCADKNIQNLDIFRLTGQMVSGIGFLCSGVIIKENRSIKGLTTASSIFLATCIGIAVGVGAYVPAIIITFIAYGFLNNMFGIKKRLLTTKMYAVIIELDISGSYSEYSDAITDAMSKMDVEIDGVDIRTISVEKSNLILKLNSSEETNINDILTTLMKIDAVIKTQVVNVITRK